MTSAAAVPAATYSCSRPSSSASRIVFDVAAAGLSEKPRASVSMNSARVSAGLVMDRQRPPLSATAVSAARTSVVLPVPAGPSTAVTPLRWVMP
jgi:hypothetical protein